MAKILLTLFGGASIAVGAGALLFGILMGPNFVAIGWGLGMLLAGAPLLGFATALDLLERIAANTQRPGAPGQTNVQTGQRIDPAVTAFFENQGQRPPGR